MTDPVALVANILANNVRYPWKTARYLHRRLADEGVTITTEALEAALLEHAASPARLVRYSFFPARGSLDLLWGHKDVVSNPDNLPDPHLQARFGEFDPCEVPEGRPWCFLSHSFRDLELVRRLHGWLLERGYGVWLAEAEVMTGMMIVKAVQDGLDISDRFVFVATPNSLASRWVLKEAIQAIKRWSLPVTVITEGTDENQPLIELFSNWLDDRWNRDNIDAQVNALESGEPPDPAATMLSDLLVSSLGEVPENRRVVALEPFPTIPPRAEFRTIDEVFPDLTAAVEDHAG